MIKRLIRQILKSFYGFYIILIFINLNVYARTIDFSGYTWYVKSAINSKAGPGPNYFTDDISDVFVDEDNKLHLKIVYRDGKWLCSEVYNQQSLGYGEYIFYLESKVNLFDKNIVVGLFTWDNNAPEYNYREIDIEFTRWGITNNQNSQYVVQPYSNTGNILRFDTILNNIYSTHKFRWEPTKITFMSLYGHKANPESQADIINCWEYTGADNPPPGEEKIDMNFWLVNGIPPSDLKEEELVIKKFEFISLANLPTPTPVTTPDMIDESENYYIKNIKIYPDPAKTKIKVNFDNKGYVKTRLTLYNIKGEKIKQIISNTNYVQWNLSTTDGYLLSPGIYLIIFEGIDNLGNNKIEDIKKIAIAK